MSILDLDILDLDILDLVIMNYPQWAKKYLMPKTKWEGHADNG